MNDTVKQQQGTGKVDELHLYLRDSVKRIEGAVTEVRTDVKTLMKMEGKILMALKQADNNAQSIQNLWQENSDLKKLVASIDKQLTAVTVAGSKDGNIMWKFITGSLALLVGILLVAVSQIVRSQ